MSVSHVVLSFGHVGHVGHDRNKMTLEDLLTPPVLSLEDPKYKALIERCTREAGDGWRWLERLDFKWKLNMVQRLNKSKCQVPEISAIVCQKLADFVVECCRESTMATNHCILSFSESSEKRQKVKLCGEGDEATPLV